MRVLIAHNEYQQRGSVVLDERAFLESRGSFDCFYGRSSSEILGAMSAFVLLFSALTIIFVNRGMIFGRSV